MGSSVLVTGGAGYVGSHACKGLAEAGFIPIAYDNLCRGHEWAVRFGPFERGDVADRERLDAVIARHRPVAVMHFAAFAYVGESVSRPDLYYRNNLVGSLTLLEAMRSADIGALVFSSSCAVYGAPPITPLTENLPLQPINPYGAGKMMVERILADSAAAGGPRYVALRYFNAAGAAPEHGIGEDHNPETHLFPLVLDAAAGRHANITIFGNDYPTADGTCVRDYVHVVDLADAHVQALNHLIAGGDNLVLNLGSGTGYSVKEVVSAAEQVTGKKVVVRIGDRRPGDPPALVADASHARKILGWNPSRGAIELQIEDAWRWHRQHFLDQGR